MPTRRALVTSAALGAAGIAVGTAPAFHRDATLDVDVEIVDHAAAVVEDVVTAIEVELYSRRQEALDPLFSTWDQKRHTRHSWEIASGAAPLPPGETSTYRLVAPGPEAGLTPGMRAQVTVYQRGTQHWRSAHFRVGGADD